MGDRDYYKPLARDLAEFSLKYQELLAAVVTKHPGETRHETALRYIQEAESRERVPKIKEGE